MSDNILLNLKKLVDEQRATNNELPYEIYSTRFVPQGEVWKMLLDGKMIWYVNPHDVKKLKDEFSTVFDKMIGNELSILGIPIHNLSESKGGQDG